MTLRSQHYDDVYFSAQDGFAETFHVFLDGNNLRTRFAALQGGDEFVIAETGFGTGLNFLAVWKLFEETAPKDARLHFVSFEKHPLEPGVMREALQSWDLDVDAMLRVYPKGGVLSDRVALALHIGDVNDLIPHLDVAVDAWFLDGFRPSSNPDMWTDTVFENMARTSKKGGTFATFTAAGFVRRGLDAAGFEVRKIPGFGRKREMAVGTLR